ncbi:MAG: cytochrome c oxidase subunit II transmembrane domain-containing protein [Candidatus Hodarchaeales archaeon]
MKKLAKLVCYSSFLTILIIILLNPIPVFASPQESTYTPQVQFLLLIVVFCSILIASTVFILLLYILIQFRESSKAPRKKIQNQVRLEVIWIVFASIIVSILFLSSLPVTQSYLTEHQDYDEQIIVTAYRYNFTFVREDGASTVGVVKLEVNKLYKFNITAIDVIHSFYVHELSIKLDMIPGRHNIIYVQISKPGVYEAHCAEYCGFGHYSMKAKIIVT